MKLVLAILLLAVPAFGTSIPLFTMDGGMVLKTVTSVTVSPHGAVVAQGDSITYTTPDCGYSDGTHDACVTANAGTATWSSFTTCYTITSGGVATWTDTTADPFGGACDPGNPTVTNTGNSGPFPAGEFTAQFYGNVCYQGVCDKFGGLAQRGGDTFYPYITPDYRAFQDGDGFGNNIYPLNVVVGSHPQMGLGYAYNNSGAFASGTPGQFTCNWASSDPSKATIDRFGQVTAIASTVGVGAGYVTMTCSPVYSTNAVHGNSTQSGWTYANGGNGINLVITNPTVVGKNWYVRINGGHSYYDATNSPTGDCDGSANVDFPGTAHHCAVGTLSQLFWDNVRNNDHTHDAWVVAGGDHIHLQANTAATGYAVGALTAQPSSPTTECYWPGGSYCYGPPVPSGTVANPTTIEGENVGNCLPDANKSFLLGTGRAKYTFNLTGSQNVAIRCVDLTQLLTCGITTGCLTNASSDQGTGQGFWISALTSNVLFEDVIVEGINGAGVFGASGYNGVSFNRFRVSFTPNGNLNMDDAPWTLSSISTAGGLTMTNAILEWAGCASQKGTSLVIPAYECRDHNNGNSGSPDAIGEGNTSGFWSFDHVICRYAGEDCFDLLHAGMQYLSITNSQTYGQEGASFKIGPSDYSQLINNQSNQNCQRQSVPVLDQPSSSIPGGANYCRGNDWMGFQVAHGGTYKILFNSMIGYQNVVFDGGCAYGYTDCTPAAAPFENNQITGWSLTSYNPGNLPGVSEFGGMLPIFVTRNNKWFNMGNCPTLNTGDTCNSVNPLYTSQPTFTAGSNQLLWDNYNFLPTPSSPMVGGGVAISGITTDINGTTRPNPPSLGSLEQGGTPTVATPTFSPVAGPYGPSQSITITTATGGASIVYTTNGSAPAVTALSCTITSGTLYSGPVTVSTSQTLKAIGCLASSNASSVASAAYVINGAVANPTCTPAAGTYGSTQSVTCSSSTGGSTTTCTIDGSTPNHGSPTCTSISVSSSLTLKALSFESGWTDSSVVSNAYTITGTVATPTFSPVAGTYSSAQSVTISTSTSGASVIYTADGSTPAVSGSTCTITNGFLYDGVVPVATSLTLKAIGCKTGLPASSVAVAGYIIGTTTTSTTQRLGSTSISGAAQAK